MSALRRWVARLAGLFGGASRDRELDAEIQSHLQLHIDDNLSAGMPVAEARRVARLEFGAVEAIKEQYRDLRGVPLIAELAQDARYAIRLMRRSPGFTLVALLSLALGIGANALVFSVVNALVLEPLPVSRPQEIVFLERGGRYSMSFPAYRDYRDRNVTFEGLAGYRISPMDLELGDTSVRLWGYLATGNYFELLGVQPAVGTFFGPGDDRPGANPVAVLSYESWRRRFWRDPAIAGKTVRINRRAFTIVGVAGEAFRGTEVFYRPEIWVPMALQAEIEVGNPWLENRFTSNTFVIGRLKSGEAAQTAAANLTAIAAQLAHEHPNSDRPATFTLVRPGLIGDTLRTPVTAFTLGVLTLAALVLVIASVNLAAALTARGTDRRRELVVRLAIGAGVARIVRQILIETLVLVSLGGVAGWVLAVVGARALSGLQLPVEVPIQFDVRADPLVLLFAFAISMAAALIAGIAPARQASRTDPNETLKGAMGMPLSTRLRLAARDVLVVAQVALCFVLVSACLLSLQGLREALTMRIGMEPQGVAMVGFDLGLARYEQPEQEAFQHRALEAVRQLPGIVSAAYGNSLPLSIDTSTTTIFPDSQPELQRWDAKSAIRYKASPGYFATLGTPLVQGRDFDWRDDSRRPRVAIVNQTFVRTILGVDRAVGRRFSYGRGSPPIEIVGVVDDGKYVSLSETPRAAVFDPILQAPSTNVVLMARSSSSEAETVAAIRRTVNTLDPNVTLYQTQSLREMLAFVLFPSRAAAVALSAFGLLAAVLAATGIYGVVSYAVARRVREIGIRIAVGASPRQILRLVMLRISTLVVIGGAIGLALSMATAAIMASVVYQASIRDPLVLAGVIASVILLGLLSSWVPARRALRLNPTVALRTE